MFNGVSKNRRSFVSNPLVGCLAASIAIAVFVSIAWDSIPRTATVEWKELHQGIDGFGASCADFNIPFSTQMADFFFTTSGIGLSLLRTQVVPSMADCQSFFGREGGECVTVPAGATVLRGELAVARQAVTRGVTVWSTPWSPPAVMKTNHFFTHGGSLLRTEYAAWAASLSGYVTLMRSNGVPIYALSVQNEPDITEKYGSATYTAQQIHDFVPILFSALQSARAESTQIMIAEASQWNFSLAKVAMEDPAVAEHVGILAAHGYGGKVSAPANYGKHVWQTEESDSSPVFNGSIEDGVAWASKIHTYLTVANVNAWHAWFLSNGHKYGDGEDNSALTDINLNYPKRAYVLGQWSRFVRPGWSRIDVRYHGHLQISAFKSQNGESFAIVAVNPTKASVRQVFSLNNFHLKSITPWITSASLSLSPAEAVPVSGTRFSYTLPALSVTTFAGTVSPVI